MHHAHDCKCQNCRVTRFEVIDETGRAYVRYNVAIELSYQDGDRTLKVFLKPRPQEGG